VEQGQDEHRDFKWQGRATTWQYNQSWVRVLAGKQARVSDEAYTPKRHRAISLHKARVQSQTRSTGKIKQMRQQRNTQVHREMRLWGLN